MSSNEVHKGQDGMQSYASSKDAVENKKHMRNAVAAIKKGLPAVYRSQMQEQMPEQSDADYQQVMCDVIKSCDITA